MALQKLKNFDPNYREALEGKDIHGFSVYADGTDEKVGSIHDLLVDEEGIFRYLIIDVGSWLAGKKVLLPIGRSRMNFQEQRVYALGMTKKEAKNLPEFNEDMTIDHDYEERVRGVYRPQATQSLGATATLDTPTSLDTSDRGTYNYQQEPDLYSSNDQDHQNLKLYEERLVASKRRQKTGEIAIGKHVGTETQQVSVPVERERVVIERSAPTGSRTAVAPGEANFQSSEVARMDIYEETADVRKEAFVREEINVRKEVDRETVETEETIRREELDVDSQGRAVEDRTRTGLNDRI